MDKKKELLKLIRTQALTTGREVVLSSGKKSTCYVDIRKISLDSQGLGLISALFLDFVKENRIDYVGGPTIGADPIIGGILVKACEENYPLKGFLVRKKPKSHGLKSQIEGAIPQESSRILLIDDVCTTGSSLVLVLERLKEISLEPAWCACVVDRQEGARQNIEKMGINFFSLFTLKEILQDV